MANCIGQRSEGKSFTLVTRTYLFLRMYSELLQPPERDSCFDLTSVQLASFCMKYSILRPPSLPNPEALHNSLICA